MNNRQNSKKEQKPINSKNNLGKPPLHHNNNNNNLNKQDINNHQNTRNSLVHVSTSSSPEKSSLAGISTQSIYDFLNDAIHEYLLKRNYHNTLECFRDEIAILPPYQQKKVNDNPGLDSQIMEAFDKGSSDMFFNKWNKYVLHNDKDEYRRKLEFYFQVYFVAYPIHPSIKRLTNQRNNNKVMDKNQLHKFKIFLETKGHELAQTAEFVQYYALPYIQNPIDHPSFKQIFTKEWITELRTRLSSYLTALASGDKPPILQQMYLSYAKHTFGNDNTSKEEEYINVISNLENSNKELMTILKEFDEKYGALLKNYNILQKNEEIARNNFFDSQSKWISFSKDLLAITNDLIHIIDNQKQGIPAQDKVIETFKSKVKSYENFLNSNMEDLIAQSQDHSVFDKFNTSQEDYISDNSSISPHSISNFDNF